MMYLDALRTQPISGVSSCRTYINYMWTVEPTTTIWDYELRDQVSASMNLVESDLADIDNGSNAPCIILDDIPPGPGLCR